MTAANQPAGSFGESRLLNRSIQVERKHLTFSLGENPLGKFVRITEMVSGRRNSIIVPLPGIEEFRDAVNGVIEFSKPPVRPVRPLPSAPRSSDQPGITKT